jgi:hypothetical protein
MMDGNAHYADAERGLSGSERIQLMRPLDWFALAAFGVICMIIGAALVWRKPPQPPADYSWVNPHYTSGKLAIAGEWITRCTDNSKVCRLTKDIDSGMAWKPDDCDSWTEPSPLNGEKIAESPARYWAAGMPGFVWLHFADGWRPQQPTIACPK